MTVAGRWRDRAFPFRVGLGAALGVSIAIPSGILATVIMAFVGGLFLGSVRYRQRDLEWLGVRHSLAAAGAIGLGYASGLMVMWSLFWGFSGFAATLVFMTIIGTPTGWFAFGLQHWAERRAEGRPPQHSRWDPRSWGAFGIVGFGILVPSGAVLWAVWTAFWGVSTSSGPNIIRYWIVSVPAVVFFLVGLFSVIRDISRKRGSDARHEPSREG